MKNKKIWIGVGAFVIAGSSVAGSAEYADARPIDVARPLAGEITDTAVPRPSAAGAIVAQKKGAGGEGGEHGRRAQSRTGGGGERAKKSQGGEGGGEEGGSKGGKPELRPDLDFALKIAKLRGHLLIGDELVKQGQWVAALPHFLHPTEEIYGDIRGRLKDYNTPPFETALKSLARVVKAKKGGEDYDKALGMVQDALAAADQGLKAKQTQWESFTVESAVELLKASANEYEEAIVSGRIAKPVEYQDARGFIWEAETMIESVAPALEKKDGEALKHLRDAIAELKKAFPAAMPPKSPVKDYGTLLGDVSRVELAAGRLM